MIIKDERRKDTFFENLRIGDAFEYEGNFYIRCSTVTFSEWDDLVIYNALRLSDSLLVGFDNDDQIKPLQATITIF